MKSSLLSVAALVASCSFAAAPELLWETDGFAGPESIVYDHQRNCFYVSNMGTWGEGQVEHDGFISRVGASGELLDAKWVTGLDNPKGLAIANGNLYVGDDHAMHEIDLDTGKLTAHHAPSNGDGASFNDCTADPDGNVYVFSSAAKKIYRLHAGRFEPWVDIDTGFTGGLNGLRAEADRLLLGGWSWRDGDGVEQLGHLSAVSYRDRGITRIGEEHIAHIDGIEPDGLGGYTVTDWLTGDVKQVSAAGKSTLLMTLVQGTADHEYVIDQQLLLIPLMKDNLVRAYRWQP